jgi:hypothetical protein
MQLLAGVLQKRANWRQERKRGERWHSKSSNYRVLERTPAATGQFTASTTSTFTLAVSPSFSGSARVKTTVENVTHAVGDLHSTILTAYLAAWSRTQVALAIATRPSRTRCRRRLSRRF